VLLDSDGSIRLCAVNHGAPQMAQLLDLAARYVGPSQPETTAIRISGTT